MPSIPGERSNGNSRPKRFVLFPIYPNPFNASTTIGYRLPSECRVKLEVFDILGMKIAALEDEVKSAGTHMAVWKGTDGVGRAVGTGIYLYRLQAGGFAGYGKMVVVK